MKTKIYILLILLSFSILWSCSKEGINLNDGFVSGTGDQYNEIIENPFINTAEQPISTFSADVDGGSFANCRKYINEGQIPPSDAIRTEEFINYFKYNYGEPDDGLPFYHSAEIAQCPWNTDHKLIRISFKGKTMDNATRKGTNFVFLIDCSGSMDSDEKLDLLKKCFENFVDQKIDYRDKVSIVTYAGSSEVVLEPTSGSDKDKIIRKIRGLSAGGSTAGAEGINTAYDLAFESFIDGGNNRIILATDGDFNVGVSNQDSLIAMIEQKRNLGIFITVIGVGHGNLNEGMMEQIADHGNGNYEFIDNEAQGTKIFVNEFNCFYPVAKDIKIQVEFDSNVVKSYRLIGYENRVMENDDFENDSVDAGDLGSDQDVTALYELEMQPDVIQNQVAATVRIRYKLLNSSTSQTFDLNIYYKNTSFENATENLRFATAVAAFAMVMRKSQYVGDTNYDDIILWIQNASTYNPFEYKTDLVEIIRKAKKL